jgi:hypothetical protein
MKVNGHSQPPAVFNVLSVEDDYACSKTVPIVVLVSNVFDLDSAFVFSSSPMHMT